MDPIIKWAGGKSRMLEHILPFVPDGKPIVEPFAGGAALTLALGREGSIIADACTPLMETYQALGSGSWRLLVAELKAYEAKHSKELYYRTRGFFNDREGLLGPRDTSLAQVRRAAAFLYLNKAGFNGLWRVNKKGHYNVPWGKRATVRFDFENLKAVRDFFRSGVGLYAMPLAELRYVLKAKPTHFWYFDPPYFNTFSNHVSAGYSADAHRALADTLEALTCVGAPWLLSHCDDPLYRELYPEDRFEITEVEVQRSIAAKAGARGKAKELLIRPRPWEAASS